MARRIHLTACALALALLLASAGTAAAADDDNDGVPDNEDACPDSVRASGEHVDAHGCTHLQIDADLDGWCNPDRPRDAQNRWLETKDEWCVGIDNCKFVPNPNQRISVPGAIIGDACNPGAWHPACPPGSWRRASCVWHVCQCIAMPCDACTGMVSRVACWHTAWCRGTGSLHSPPYAGE
jgi:hypothetical protein